MNRTFKWTSALAVIALTLSWLHNIQTRRFGLVNREKAIYATYLSKPSETLNYLSEFHNSSDPYFDAARILTYQVLHAPETRTRLDIEFVIFVHENVDPEKKDRLRRDGAHLIEWKDFSVDWVRPKDARWTHIMTKLRLWQMVQYDLVLFLDVDTVLSRPLDDIFSAPEIYSRAPVLSQSHHHEIDVPPPGSYFIAGLPQLRTNHSAHPSRVPEDFWDWFTINSGFMVLKPSLDVFRYFEAVLKVTNSFDGSIGDQSVLNHVFSPFGPMPWVKLNLTWNIQWPCPEDIRSGAYASFHEKWWAQMHWETNAYFLSWYWRMVGYYDSIE
ncbi:putative glycosyl transferase family 8 family [Aspergillus affinis]|uniref:putative glycosyl transferase family 8 family n=1 Tax=Aspergillus affinis TaxID=1070780 RepID=UPI0022FEDA33|nr:uncharacterized protein KD926_004049 [Aspergillus affinis]KAI9046211.1 hypothetical protein KD926_004049 [Aspergillus affinis]